jgi:hypothetical protein
MLGLLTLAGMFEVGKPHLARADSLQVDSAHFSTSEDLLGVSRELSDSMDAMKVQCRDWAIIGAD